MRRSSLGIVIAAWNAQDTIDAALASIVGQTVTPAQVVVVDDGSADETIAQARKWSSLLPLVVIESPKQRGPAAARNMGVQLLETDRISFLDADDVLLPNHVDVHSRFSMNQASILTSWGIHWFSEVGRYRPWKPASVRVKRQRTEILRRNFVPIWSSFPRSLYINLGGQRNNLMEDYDFWIRAIRSGTTVEHAAEYTYLYRVRPGSRSRSDDSIRLITAALSSARSELNGHRDRRALRTGLRHLSAAQSLGLARHELSKSGYRSALLPAMRVLKNGDYHLKVRAGALLVLPKLSERQRNGKSEN